MQSEKARRAREKRSQERKAFWAGVQQRLQLIEQALELPPSEIKAASKYRGIRGEPLLDFARRYNQDLNWLFCGDVGSMCHKMAWNGGWRPKHWTNEMEKDWKRSKAKWKNADLGGQANG